MRSFIIPLLLVICVNFWTGCATVKPFHKVVPPEQLFNWACSPGKNNKKVTGTVWLKAKSEDMSGQFSANVVAEEPSRLVLEVTNFLGGTEAKVSVAGGHYAIERSRGEDKGKIMDEGRGSWAGIPVDWAADLFLGKIPCPAQFTMKPKNYRMSLGSSNELTVEVFASDHHDRDNQANQAPVQKFVYFFRERNGQAWPQELHWTRKDPVEVSADFKFDQPDEGTGSPLKWEANSTTGLVKVRWRERKVAD